MLLTMWSLKPGWVFRGPCDARPLTPAMAWTPQGAELGPLCFQGGPSLRECRSLARGGVAAGFESSAPFLEATWQGERVCPRGTSPEL